MWLLPGGVLLAGGGPLGGEWSSAESSMCSDIWILFLLRYVGDFIFAIDMNDFLLKYTIFSIKNGCKESCNFQEF